MLKTLRVKNLALVESIRVEFQSGLNVITGETGAGKSMLIGALSLLMGERADKRLIRAGEDACGAEALFELPEAGTLNALLESLGLDPCEDGQLVIRRVVKASGANQITVNDSPVTVQALKQIGDLLVDLHGPHDHQSLLSPEFQLNVLDAYGHLEAEREAFETVFREREALKEQRDALAGSDEEGVAEQMDLLAYKIKELETAAPVEGEEEKVEEEQRIAGNAQRVLELGQLSVQALMEGEASAFNALAVAQKSLEELSRLMPSAQEWREEVLDLSGRIQELNVLMQSAMEKVEADPARLAWLDERLAVYQMLKRKYAPTVPELLALLEKSRTRLSELATRGERLATLEKDIEKARQELRRLGGALGKKRRGVAEKLAAAITRELKALGFAHGAFSIDLQTAEPRLSGTDALDFGFAPNAGEPASALRAIASSGEISRVMLAIKVVLANHDRIPVLVFDEIDSNVGGEMGNAVGRKLAEVARTHQVLCVTHLPQVAACGTHHLAVTKAVREGRTFTEVQALSTEDRIEELARMLGGKDLTSVTLKHAREMLKPPA